MNVGVIGLGKLGLPLACLFSKSHDVWGLDIDSRYITELRNGVFQTWEPDCDYSSVHFTSSYPELIFHTNIAFVCVDTPSIPDGGGMDLSQIYSVVRSMYAHTTMIDKKYSLVVCSTVPPGTCRNIIKSYFITGYRVSVYSSPVWVALGTVVRDLRQPPTLVVGADDFEHDGLDREERGQEVVKLWMSVAEVAPMNICITDTKTAEFLKLAHNAHCVEKMAFMGYLADKANELDINIRDVSRFFQHGGDRPGVFWRPGPPPSGPCFPRDLELWNNITHHPITIEVERINKDRVMSISLMVGEGTKVLIHGSGYRPGIPIIKDSLSFWIKEILENRGCDVVITDGEWDPKFIPEFCILTHEGKYNLPLPEDCKIINLW